MSKKQPDLLLAPLNLGIFLKRDVPVVSSRDVARVFGKEHKNVLQAIERLDCSEEFRRLNFQPSSYRNDQNKRQPEYLMTRDGFTFLAMGFTGKKAAAFKEAYIRRFNEMEQQLRERAISKVVRRSLTDAIQEAGLNELMHGFAYKTFTDLVYRVAIGCTAAQYRKEHGLPKDANVRDYLDDYQLRRVQRAEKLAAALADNGADYSYIKAVLEEMFMRPVLVEKSGS